MRERGLTVTWPGASFGVKLPDPSGSGRLLTLFGVSRYGRIYIGWLASQLETLGLPQDIADEFAKDSADLFGIKVHPTERGCWKGDISIGQLRPAYDSFVEFELD